jgi:hypothetical protein
MLATQMRFTNQWALEYIDHVSTVEAMFLHEEHPKLFVGPQAIKESTRSLASWEEGLNLQYERYPE